MEHLLHYLGGGFKKGQKREFDLDGFTANQVEILLRPIFARSLLPMFGNEESPPFLFFPEPFVRFSRLGSLESP